MHDIEKLEAHIDELVGGIAHMLTWDDDVARRDARKAVTNWEKQGQPILRQLKKILGE